MSVTVDVADLPEGFVVMKALLIVEGIDPTAGDDTTLVLRTTDGVKVWQTLGMLAAATTIEERHCRYQWDPEDDDEDG